MRQQTAVMPRARSLDLAAWQVPLGLLVAAAAATAVSRAQTDPTTDLGLATDAALRWCASAVSAFTWQLFGALLVISFLHYLAAAAASRAAAGVRLPIRELLAIQLTAAAANRLTPAGLGGAGVTGRFFSRRGGLQPTEAVAAVSALAVLGAVADVGAFGLLIGVGLLLGSPGAGREVPLLLSRLTALVPVPGALATGVLVAVGVVVVAVGATPRVRRSRAVARLRAAAGQFGRAVSLLLRRPARLASLLAASAGTTLALAAGFATAASLGPTGLPPAAFGASMIGYMVAAAAGNALPTPGGVGAADAGFVAVLLAAGAAATPAVATVFAFRLVTFWIPAACGALLARRLRRAGAL